MSKYTLKRTKLHHVLNFFGGACPQTPQAMEGATRRVTSRKQVFQVFLELIINVGDK